MGPLEAILVIVAIVAVVGLVAAAVRWLTRRGGGDAARPPETPT